MIFNWVPSSIHHPHLSDLSRPPFGLEQQRCEQMQARSTSSLISIFHLILPWCISNLTKSPHQPPFFLVDLCLEAWRRAGLATHACTCVPYPPSFSDLVINTSTKMPWALQSLSICTWTTTATKLQHPFGFLCLERRERGWEMPVTWSEAKTLLQPFPSFKTVAARALGTLWSYAYSWKQP
jgi:hypothetical protein